MKKKTVIAHLTAAAVKLERAMLTAARCADVSPRQLVRIRSQLNGVDATVVDLKKKAR